MPKRTWTEVVLQTGRDLWTGNAAEWAAALACYAVLSLFPLMVAGAVAASVAVDSSWAAERVSALLAEFLPEGAIEVERIVAAAAEDRSRVGAASLAVSLLSGRRVLGALTKALDVVSDLDELPTRCAAGRWPSWPSSPVWPLWA